LPILGHLFKEEKKIKINEFCRACSIIQRFNAFGSYVQWKNKNVSTPDNLSRVHHFLDHVMILNGKTDFFLLW